MIDIIIPTRWDKYNLENLFDSLSKQTFGNFKVLLILDKEVNELELLQSYKEIIQKYSDINITLVNNYESDFVTNKWVSYNRNYWINMSKSEYIFLLDDDNVFDDDLLINLLEKYSYLSDNTKNEFIVSPIINYRKQDLIQSWWIIWINYFLWKVVLNSNYENDYSNVKMIWWNSLFWKSAIFKKNLFDELFWFVYEDLDFSWWIVDKGIDIIILNKVKIYHMERTKNVLEKSFIWDSKTAYQKARNRIILIKKHVKWKDLFIYFTFWLFIQTIWFIYLIVLHWKNKFSLIGSVIRGTYDWLIIKV